MPQKPKETPDRRPAAPGFRAVFPVAKLSGADPTPFDLRPDAEQTSEIKAFLGLITLEGLRLRGKLVPMEEGCWRADGRLTARLDQACVVTLDPVPQKIDEKVSRPYVPADRLEDGPELDLDMDEDDPDGYEREIDLAVLMLEALALALEPYPRAEGAELATDRATPAGAEPITDESLKPFAKLEALRAKLSGSEP